MNRDKAHRSNLAFKWLFMRKILCIVVLGAVLQAGAQKGYDHELQLTETRFALESQIHGLKWGFLHNMDTAALGINNQGFVRLYSVWKARPDQSSFLLQWKPTAIWWSEDGLFGLTTGPFFTQPAKDSTTRATGYFFTIWQRAATTEPFKFVVDAGVQMTPGQAPSAFVSTPVVKEPIAIGNRLGKVPTAVQTACNSSLQGFYTRASGGSLLEALTNHMHLQSFLLVSDLGKLSQNNAGQVDALNRRHSFQRIGLKSLSTTCSYEWGQFRSADQSTAYSGFYVHVWQVQGQKPLLLAAVYQFDQSLKKRKD